MDNRQRSIYPELCAATSLTPPVCVVDLLALDLTHGSRALLPGSETIAVLDWNNNRLIYQQATYPCGIRLHTRPTTNIVS